jgi:hypothetical protein
VEAALTEEDYWFRRYYLPCSSEAEAYYIESYGTPEEEAEDDRRKFREENEQRMTLPPNEEITGG